VQRYHTYRGSGGPGTRSPPTDSAADRDGFHGRRRRPAEGARKRAPGLVGPGARSPHSDGLLWLRRAPEIRRAHELACGPCDRPAPQASSPRFGLVRVIGV